MGSLQAVHLVYHFCSERQLDRQIYTDSLATVNYLNEHSGMEETGLEDQRQGNLENRFVCKTLRKGIGCEDFCGLGKAQ